MALKLPDRYPLAALPTPLVRSRRLERVLDSPPILVKRDDLTGFALAGNKARKLEFLLGDALAGGCDVLVTGGGPGSNHCQATAAAARVAGLSCHLVMYGTERAPVHPNLAFARCLGATVSFTGQDGRGSVDPALAEVADGLAAAGHRPYVIPRGGATAVGAAGYGLAVAELAGQLRSLEMEPEIVIVATGSCGTQAGLLAGRDSALPSPADRRGNGEPAPGGMPRARPPAGSGVRRAARMAAGGARPGRDTRRPRRGLRLRLGGRRAGGEAGRRRRRAAA